MLVEKVTQEAKVNLTGTGFVAPGDLGNIETNEPRQSRHQMISESPSAELLMEAVDNDSDLGRIDLTRCDRRQTGISPEVTGKKYRVEMLEH
jgi:hypothetical protein